MKIILEVGKKYKTDCGKVWFCEMILDKPGKYLEHAVMYDGVSSLKLFTLNGKAIGVPLELVEEAKPRPFKVGDVTCTRDGRRARIICVDRVDKCYPIIALVMNDNGNTEDMNSYRENGRFLLEERPYDLEPIYE